VIVVAGDATVLLDAFRFSLHVAGAGLTSGDSPGKAEYRKRLVQLRELAGDTPFLVVPAGDAIALGPLNVSIVHRDPGGE
jgi:hypothetical protein